MKMNEVKAKVKIRKRETIITLEHRASIELITFCDSLDCLSRDIRKHLGSRNNLYNFLQTKGLPIHLSFKYDD